MREAEETLLILLIAKKESTTVEQRRMIEAPRLWLKKVKVREELDH